MWNVRREEWKWGNGKEQKTSNVGRYSRESASVKQSPMGSGVDAAGEKTEKSAI